MAKIHEPVRVAVNVMRARITVVGFNIAIITFQIAMLSRISGGVRLPSLKTAVHFQADIALFMALALSLVALVSFILSSAFDRDGTCDHWTLLLGDLFMYLGLAHTVAGFFGPFTGALGRIAADLPDHGTEMTTVLVGVAFAGGTAWFLATYLGPIVSLLRSPFAKSVTRALAGVYLVTLLALAWVSGQAARLEATLAHAEAEPPPLVLEFVQPLRW
jgi:hypothetical protein